MIPVGYMAKRIALKPDWLDAAGVVDLYSVSGCTSECFLDDLVGYAYEIDSKINGWYFFDSPQQIESLACQKSIDLKEAQLFYYEAHELEYAAGGPRTFQPEHSIRVSVEPPASKQLAGFHVVTFRTGRFSECSPLSCNSLATDIHTNSHCLLDSFDEAEAGLNSGELLKGEVGPYRIFAVYLVDWPRPLCAFPQVTVE